MPALHYVPRCRNNELAGHDWLWLDCPNGDRYMLMASDTEVSLDDEVVAQLAVGVLLDRAKVAS